MLLINHCGFTAGITKSHVDPTQKINPFVFYHDTPQQTFTELIFYLLQISLSQYITYRRQKKKIKTTFGSQQFWNWRGR